MEKKVFWIALCAAVLFCFDAAAQPDYESIVQQMAEDGASEAQIEDYLQQLPAGGRGLDINSASRAELERSGLFTPFQTASLLDYRTEYGSILSAAELALVDGFSAEKVAALQPFIVIGAGAVQQPGIQHDFRTRYKFGQEGGGSAQYNRLIVKGGFGEVCLLAESDAGERLFTDHLSGSLRLEKGRWQFVAGDYLAGFGQGLAVWKGFSFSGLGAPASLLRRSRGVTCNHTADENDFFRGAACTYRKGGGSFTTFVSANGVDANVGASGYTSIVTTGYHRTESEKAKKDAMREYVAGADFTYTGGHSVWNVTAVAYSYNRPNARKIREYNQFQVYDGPHGNIAAGGMLSLGHTRLFAELAADSRLAPAALAGAVFSPSYSFEAALHLRYYDKRYIATHAGSYSSASAVANQQGAVLSLLCRPGKVLQLTSMTSLVHYPWQRYRIDVPSTDFRQKTRAEWKWERCSASVQHNLNYSTADRTFKHDVKIGGKCSAGRLELALRSDLVVLRPSESEGENGFALAGDISWKGAQKRLRLAAGATYYDADSYDSRAYIYENDLPGSFSSHFFYGRGAAYRLMMQYRIAGWMSLSAKISKSEKLEAKVQADLLF